MLHTCCFWWGLLWYTFYRKSAEWDSFCPPPTPDTLHSRQDLRCVRRWQEEARENDGVADDALAVDVNVKSVYAAPAIVTSYSQKLPQTDLVEAEEEREAATNDLENVVATTLFQISLTCLKKERTKESKKVANMWWNWRIRTGGGGGLVRLALAVLFVLFSSLQVGPGKIFFCFIFFLMIFFKEVIMGGGGTEYYKSAARKESLGETSLPERLFLFDSRIWNDLQTLKWTFGLRRLQGLSFFAQSEKRNTHKKNHSGPKKKTESLVTWAQYNYFSTIFSGAWHTRHLPRRFNQGHNCLCVRACVERNTHTTE